MQLQWSGHYFDGKRAERRSAAISLEPTALRIKLDDGATLFWPYAEIRQIQGAYAGEEVRLEHGGGELAEVLLIADIEFLASLHRMLPNHSRSFHNPARRMARLRLTILAACAAVVLIAGFYLWGIPSFAAVVAPWVPISWEERLGVSVMGYLAPPERHCDDPARRAELEKLLDTLIGAETQNGYHFRLVVVNEPTFNALAAPGGNIIIYRGLLERTRSAEELAGVLAHELQHVLKRHVTRALVEHASTGLLAAAVLGDVGGLASFGVEAARLIARMRFNRQHELEADEAGLRMLIAAGIDPAGMIEFFEVVRKEEAKLPSMVAHLSSHPQTEVRIARLKKLAAGAVTRPRKLVGDNAWKSLKQICPAETNSRKE